MSFSKKLLIVIGVFVLVVGISVVSFFLNRDRNNLLGGGGRPAAVATNDAEIKEIVVSYEKTKPYIETSVEKIESAQKNKTITEEQSILYQVIAIFNPDKLHDQYKGAPDNEKDHAYLFATINQQWNLFSEPTKSALLPFLLSPDDPKSYFNRDLQQKDKDAVWENIFGITGANAAGSWKQLKSDDQTTILYNGTEYFPQAQWAEKGAKDSIPKFKELLAVNPKMIDVYISDTSMSGYGEAYLSPVSNDVCIVRLSASLDEKLTKSSAAHEIFHCFQFFYGFKYEKSDMKWFMEATATWAEDFVYHDAATEHYYDDSFLDYTNWDLLDKRNTHHYGSYLWYYYLSQRFDPYEIMQAFVGIKQNGSDPRKMLGTQTGFSDEFKEFVFWNWNRNPFKFYKDSPDFPSVHPSGESVEIIDVNKNGDFSEPVHLTTGSSKYYMYNFTNEDVKRINFNFDIPDSDAKGIQASYKIGDTWYYEDLSSLKEKEFCRDIDEENIKTIVLMTSNSDLENDLFGNIKLKTEKKCGPGWQGTIRVSWKKDLHQGWVTDKDNAYYTIHEKLFYDPETNNFRVKESNFSAHDSNSYVEKGATCGVIYSSRKGYLTGGGNYIFDEKDENADNVRISGQSSNENGFGGEYNLSLAMLPDPNESARKKQFKGVSYSQLRYRDCTYILSLKIDDQSTAETTDLTGEGFGYTPNSVDIQIGPDDKQIKGNTTFDMGDSEIGTAEWSFQRI